jgi:hypothetical protein
MGKDLSSTSKALEAGENPFFGQGFAMSFSLVIQLTLRKGLR